MSQLISLISCLLVAILSVQISAQTCPAPSPCTCQGTEIVCSGLGVTAVPQFEFSDSHTRLALDQNDIEEVPDNAFRNLPNLDYLDLAANKLKTVHPKAFNGLSRLEELYLGNNQLQTLQENAYDTLTQLSILSLHKNNLTTIYPKAFNGLSRLQELGLAYNKLQTLPGNVFDPLPALSELFLSDNNLKNFPVQSLARAVGGRRMYWLFLSDNPNLPCNIKQEILSNIQMPHLFLFASPCAVPTAF